MLRRNLYKTIIIIKQETSLNYPLSIFSVLAYHKETNFFEKQQQDYNLIPVRMVLTQKTKTSVGEVGEVLRQEKLYMWTGM